MSRESRDRDATSQQPTEVTVSATDMRSETSMQVPDTGTLDFKLELVVVPVSDADRAKRFYASLGWREDADFVISEDYRVLQEITERLPGRV
jgi:hypothetical protein